MDKARETLQTHWGYDDFRPGQAEVIQAALEGSDVFALMATGAGKSVCYQVPALLLPGLTLIISPLIALMKDQVEGLRRRGIASGALTGHHTRREQDAMLGMARDGAFKMLYLSPEKLAGSHFREWLPHLPIQMIVSDEAHCVSQWGYDFRPSYLQIPEVAEAVPHARRLALTASATPRAAADIIEKLALRNPFRFNTGFDRPNLHLSVRHVESKPAWITEHLAKLRSTGIVYAPTRRETLETARAISGVGGSADFYHAGLEIQARERKQRDWTEGRTRCMVSTNAFGMGIDKADVRYVVHQRLPVSLEAYYQEAGRAGRDGKKSTAVALWYPQDETHMRERLEEGFPSDEEVQRVYSALMHHFALPIGSGAERFFPFDADAFAQAFRIHTGLLHNALGILELSGLLKVNDAVRIQARVRILGDYAGIYEFKVYHPQYDDVINAMLRLLPGVFDHYVPVNEKKLAMLLARPEPDVVRQLVELDNMEQIDYLPERNKPGITLLRDHEMPLRLDKSRIAAIRNNRLEALQAVFDYVHTPGCRMQFLRRYFGEMDAGPCGHCDRCTEAAGKEQEGGDTRALRLAECLRQAGSLSPSALMEQAGVEDEDFFRQVVKEWMQRGLVSLNEIGCLKWKGSASA